MGDNYVELMWRVVRNHLLVAAFINLDDAKAFAEVCGGKVFAAVTNPVFVDDKK